MFDAPSSDDKLRFGDEEKTTNEIQEFDSELQNVLQIDTNLPKFAAALKQEYESLTTCQKTIVDFINQNLLERFLIFVWGPAGTGESYFLNHIEKLFKTKGLRVAKLATTGQAAKLIGGDTVHSFLVSISTQK